MKIININRVLYKSISISLKKGIYYKNKNLNESTSIWSKVIPIPCTMLGIDTCERIEEFDNQFKPIIYDQYPLSDKNKRILSYILHAIGGMIAGVLYIKIIVFLLTHK